MMNNSNDALKFVWAYMIEKGRLTNGVWSYYGSSFDGPILNSYDWEKSEKEMKLLRHTVKTVGINWEKTHTPTSSQESCFDGTFVESSTTETLLGTLVLNNDLKFLIGVSNVETRFQGYVEFLHNFMEDKQRQTDILGE